MTDNKMNNETKRDVLKQALCYVPVGEEYDAIQDSPAGDLYDKLLEKYDAALPDDLPTIPQNVSQEIKDTYTKYGLMDVLNWAFQDAIDPEVAYWIRNNEALFAEAWGRGVWIVKH